MYLSGSSSHGSSSHGSSSHHARTSAAVLGILLSASLLSACADDDVPELPEGVDEDDTYLPSAEPSAENPHGAEDIDVSQDVGMAAVNTVISEHEGQAIGFTQEREEGENGMVVDVLSGETLISTATNPEGTGIAEELGESEAEEELVELAEQAEVPLLRAMQIARSESAGTILEAALEPREDGLVVWTITVEGPSSESTTVIDANNAAIVPEGDDPLRDNNIGGDPDNAPEEGAAEE